MERVTTSQEYATLVRAHKELVAAHERLESSPYDQEAHQAHRERLIEHNKRLHDFIAAHLTKPNPGERRIAKGERRHRAEKGLRAKKPSRSVRRR